MCKARQPAYSGRFGEEKRRARYTFTSGRNARIAA